MSAAPEFSRPIALDRIGAGETRQAIEAGASERAALAGRFGLVAVDALAAEAALSRDRERVRARGTVTADVVQACVVTGDPVPAHVEEDFDIAFLPATLSSSEEEIELSEGECDTIFYEGGAVDIGEAAAQTMALALDPWPRSPRAEEALREAGVLSEEEAGPFGALKGLRDTLSKEQETKGGDGPE